MTDTETRLGKVRDAIDAILGGAQSYTIDNVTYNRASLASLMAMEERYEQKLEKEQRGFRRISKCVFPPEG